MASNGLEIATGLLNEFTEIKVKELLQKRPWMEGKSFILLNTTIEIEKYIDHCIEKGLCALDLETTGLSTRKNRDGESCTKIVGVCLATGPDEGVYIPVLHQDKEFNVSLKFIIRELARLVANCRCIYHNFKYDGEILRNHGIIMENEELYEDTMLMAAVEDASRKEKGLKFLVEHLLGREMIEIDELGIQGSKKDIVAFDMVPPQKAVYYGASDAMCTFALYQYFKMKIDEQDPTGKSGPWAVYKIEKRCLFVTMEMERNLVKIDRPYIEKCKVDVIARIQKCLKGIHEIAGRDFDVNSPKQLGILLFEELKIPYPVKEKTATNQYITNEKVLEKLEGKYPIVDMILTYRGYVKVLETYIENFLRNADENDEVKFNLNQVRADTGRFSSTGGHGLLVDGYSGVNCQNIPNYDPDNPNSVDLRRAVIARPGYKIVSIDYSGEELRIAANFSKEPLWLKEFLEGTGDLHSITGRIIYKKQDISKKERGTGKTLNFLTLYGGGAGGFATKAKIPYETAKKMIIHFFEEYKGIKSWIDRESRAARKRGYSKTAFGRRRPLHQFYSSPDKKDQAFADRCAINSAIQGTGADVIKIALYRIWKWIHTSGLEEDIKILAPVHDEVVFEVKEDKLEAMIPEMCRIMRLEDVTAKLQWQVPFEVDAEYGDSFHVDHDFWKEQKKKKAELQQLPKQDPPKEVPEEKNEQPVELPKEEPPVAAVNNEVTQDQPAGHGDAPQEEEVKQKSPGIEEKNDSDVTVSVSKEKVVGSTVSDGAQYYINITVKSPTPAAPEKRDGVKEVLRNVDEQKIANTILDDARLKDRVDQKGFFNYSMDINGNTALTVRHIMEILMAIGDRTFLGPKYRLCLLSKEGEVYYRSSEPVSIDAFVALCFANNI